MAPPDLNSLPPSSPLAIPLRTVAATTTTTTTTNGSASTSTSLSGSGESPSPSPRSASISLQAAATVNAGLQHEPGRRPSSSSLSRQRQSPQAGRRRSAVLMNLQLNDPTLPAPGELVAGGVNNNNNANNNSNSNNSNNSNNNNSILRTMSPQPLSLSSPLLTGRDPHHNRAPSLGELHQELEAEQEAQVNRLLQMIRQQQLQLQQLQAAQGQAQSTVAAEDPPSTSDRSTSMSHPPSVPPSLPTPSGSIPRSPSVSHPRSSFDLARDALHRRSRTPSRGASLPRLRSTSISQEGEPHLSGVRDETTYYQAETQSLIRENQMLRHRIRELERQISEAHANVSITREPVQPSHLTHSTSVSEEDAAEASPVAASQLPAASETKDE
ncbi:hypothetical protein F4823DRAFT_568512 [Ustulina deusta]|nr:hypothetical protein F4823DRAFT_568512 [Ustulina deusta]